MLIFGANIVFILESEQMLLGKYCKADLLNTLYHALFTSMFAADHGHRDRLTIVSIDFNKCCSTNIDNINKKKFLYLLGLLSHCVEHCLCSVLYFSRLHIVVKIVL